MTSTHLTSVLSVQDVARSSSQQSSQDNLQSGTAHFEVPQHDQAIRSSTGRFSQLAKRSSRYLRSGNHSVFEQQLIYYKLIQLRDSSEAYRKYRDGKDKRPRNDAEPVWPDYAEEAFWQGTAHQKRFSYGRSNAKHQNLAIVHYPPMGRHLRQLGPDEKRMGRNELIAVYLENCLGSSFFAQLTKGKEQRKRKIVSSHIQVEKQKFCRKVLNSEGKQIVVPLLEYYFGTLSVKRIELAR